MTFLRLFTITSLIFIGACSDKLTVESDFEQKTDFTKLTSFKWESVPLDPSSETEQSIAFDNIIRREVDKNMAEKGFTKTDGFTDILVNYRISFKDKTAEYAAVTEPNSNDLAAGKISWNKDGVSFQGWDNKGSEQSFYQKGTLYILMKDAGTGKILWRGYASKVVDQTPDKDYQRAEKVGPKMIEKIFKQYPPKQ